MELSLETQLSSFRLPDCACQQRFNQPFAKVCLAQGCAQLLCPRCDSKHVHKDKMVSIYDLLESLINTLSEQPISEMNPDKKQPPQKILSPSSSLDETFEFISKNILRIEKCCQQIRSNLDKIRSQHQEDPMKHIIKDAILNIFQNSQSKDVISQELAIILKQINITDLITMQFESRGSEKQQIFMQQFGKYKAKLESYLKEAETIMQKATYLDIQKDNNSQDISPPCSSGKEALASGEVVPELTPHNQMHDLNKKDQPTINSSSGQRNASTKENLQQVEKGGLMSVGLVSQPEIKKKEIQIKGFGDFKKYFEGTNLDELLTVTDLVVDLEDNGIGEKGAEHVSAALSKLSQLSHLEINLSYNRIGDKGAEHVSAPLSKLSQLSHLDINLQNNSIGEKGAEHVAVALSKLTQLSHLGINLQNNSIGEKGAEHVSAPLSKLTQLSHLDINLQKNSIGEKGAEHVAAALSKLTRLSHLDINLRYNYCEDSGQIEETIRKALPNVKELKIWI